MVYNQVYQKVVALRAHLKIPFFNNAYSLIGVQAAASFLGFVFWVLVTRFLPTNQVGLGTGIFSAALLLTGFAELGFGDGLTYYLPRVAYPDRLINAYFSLSGLLVLLLAAIFIFGQRFFSPSLDILRQSPLTVAAFIGCTLLIHLGTLQDYLFVADRVSKYSLSKNILSNLLRFPLFFVFFFTREWSLILSAGISFLVGMFLIGKQYQKVERPVHRFKLELAPHVWKPILGFSFGNYVVNTMVGLPNTLLPLIVLNRLGPASSGYFYIAWMLASFLSVIGRSFGVSLFVESGRDINSIKKNTIRSLVVSSIFLIPCVILMVVFSSQILMIFGKQYSIEAATLVKLLSISCIPMTFYGITVGVLKAQGKIREMLVLAVIFTGLHVGGGVWFLSSSALSGVGIAVIIARLLSSILAFVFAFRGSFRSLVSRGMLANHSQ